MFCFGKMGKNRPLWVGRTKNQNKCSVFLAAYKLVHLHTNLKIKPLNQNPPNPNKITTFQTSTPKIPISHPISSNLTKINTFTHHTTQIQTPIQTTFFLYKYKILRKIHTFTDYQLFIKNHINNIKNSHLSPIQKENIKM